jgi:hypothetical protein
MHEETQRALNEIIARQCGNCRHWHKLPSEPTALGQVRGQCRESPPALVPMGGNMGQLVVNAMYPPLPPNFDACSRFEAGTPPTVKCPACCGSGRWALGGNSAVCDACAGSGQVVQPQETEAA